MSFQNDREAFCLANTYNLSPPRKKNPARLRLVDPGKYEPDHTPTAASRCMVLASYIDKTNVIVQYTVEDLENFI